MKNLVLGALLAAAVSSTACGTSSDTSAVITARWSFNTYENRNGPPIAACPDGFTTAAVYARPWDPFVGDFVASAEQPDLFDCDLNQGTTLPLDGVFQVWVQIENTSGSSVYAVSESIVIDTADGDATIDLPTLFTNAGYFDLSWNLTKNGTRVHCADAGIGPSGQITAVVMATSSTAMAGGKFDCEDGFGVSDPLLVDDYLVTVTASSAPGTDVGVSDPIDHVLISAPSGLTHLGVVKIPVN